MALMLFLLPCLAGAAAFVLPSDRLRRGLLILTALVHTGLGENQRALDWLDTACERRELPLCNSKVHPGYQPLRAESRFAALLARIGLAD